QRFLDDLVVALARPKYDECFHRGRAVVVIREPSSIYARNNNVQIRDCVPALRKICKVMGENYGADGGKPGSRGAAPGMFYLSLTARSWPAGALRWSRATASGARGTCRRARDACCRATPRARR